MIRCDRRDGTGASPSIVVSFATRGLERTRGTRVSSPLVVLHESDPTPRARVNERATDDESSLGRLMIVRPSVEISNREM